MPTTAEPPPPRARPGRRRSEESRRAILGAALDLVGEGGFAGLTVEGVAARAGVGKQTIYRWWPSKADVLLDALVEEAELRVPAGDHGGYAADLRAFLGDTFRLGSRPWVAEVLRALMAHAQVDPAFGERFRDSFLRARRDALRRIVERARERGDLPPRPAPDTVLDLVFGVLWYRILATREPLDEALVGELLSVLVRS
ncbi:TetR/AcrR family transcriptional regulator [Streptomyces litchfieldiae]|uniref:TetR/AcrR family transcriptional regulator n=1 Tax=Streptomyces litchfieldiae TaxID=3075543 RepID=A0ABU2MLK4_9ACTN|nr:TetR/AcrR family transcriptional regulator [Streptomyces sp. DSM 44938]MDT0342486.1 TetR/AcrR family transcriptional regulator [Streptomyces sp. DSM 44938]